MQLLEIALLAGGIYALASKKTAITQPTQGQIIRFSQFPASLTVKGSAARPLTVSLFTGTNFVDSTEVNGNFTATLEVQGPGPHEIKWKDKDAAGYEVSATILITIKDSTVTPPPPEFDIATLVGTNYLDPVLRRKEKEAARPYDPAYVEGHLTELKSKGHNFLRVVVYWEAMYPYAQNRENVLKQLEEIARVAETKGMMIVIDHHHFHGSSSWKFIADNGQTRSGGGLPSFVVQSYPTNQPYQTSVYINQSVKDWFAAFYTNNVFGINNIWQRFFDEFWLPIIQRLDKYDSVLGYEILNELQYFDEPQISQAGVFHSFIASQMRLAGTQKAVVWDEGNVRGNLINGAYARANQHLAAPQDSNIIYAPHTYGVGTQLDGHIEDFKRTQTALGGIPVFIGEHAPQDNNLTQANMDYQMQSFKNAGFGSTYWAYAASETLGPGNNIRIDGNNPNTGTMYYAARAKVYGY